MIWAGERFALADLYTEWINERGCEVGSPFNVIGFLSAEGLLDEDKVREFLRESGVPKERIYGAD